MLLLAQRPEFHIVSTAPHATHDVGMQWYYTVTLKVMNWYYNVHSSVSRVVDIQAVTFLPIY